METSEKTTTVEEKISTLEVVETTETEVPKKIFSKYFEFLKTFFTNLFTPNTKVDYSTTLTILVLWIVGTLFIWLNSESKLLPSPIAIFTAGKRMFVEHEFFRELVTSLLLVFKAMAYSITICYVLATASTLEFFRPIASFFAKSRFLTTVGLSVVFAQLTPDTSSQKAALLIFSVTVFLVTSFLGILLDIKKEEFNYAKTLKMSNWKSFYEIVILGKADLFMEAIRQNFAIAWMMLPMVENYCRADGGIGIVLTDQQKYFHLDAVYSIQIMVLFIGIGLDLTIGYLKGLIRPDTLLTLARK